MAQPIITAINSCISNASAIKLGISSRPCCSTRSSRKLARCSQSDLTAVLVDFSVCRTHFPAVYLSGGPLVLSDRLSSLLSGIPAFLGYVASGRGGGGCLSRQSSGFGSRSRRFERNKNVSSPSTCESQYCGEPPWPRSSVLGLRPPGLEFRILCLEDSVISIISPSSGGSPGPV